MKNKICFLLKYSGMDVYDYNYDWYIENKGAFCSQCSCQISPTRYSIDLILDSKINKSLDMALAGHVMIPNIMSKRVQAALGKEGERNLNFGKVYYIKNGIRLEQDHVSFTSKNEYVVLRGKTPSSFKGAPIPDSERLHVCPECGRKARRERAPWFLFEEEVPSEPIACAQLGLIVADSIYDRIRQIKTKAVLVEKIEIIQNQPI